jgi:hypothetical protein
MRLTEARQGVRMLKFMGVFGQMSNLQSEVGRCSEQSRRLTLTSRFMFRGPLSATPSV